MNFFKYDLKYKTRDGEVKIKEGYVNTSSDKFDNELLLQLLEMVGDVEFISIDTEEVGDIFEDVDMDELHREEEEINGKTGYFE